MTHDLARDFLGNPVSATRREALAAIDDFARGFLGYEPRIVNVLAAAEEATEALVQVYAGLLWMLSETGGVPAQARDHARRARLDRRINPRESLLLEALEQWIDGEMPAMRRTLRAVLKEWPRDLVALKVHQYDDFNNGRALDMLRVTVLSENAAADSAHFHAMRAFAFEQCRLLPRAREAAERALALDPLEPWAQHALAHVLLTTGRIEEGRAFLQARSGEWERLTSFMYTHLWWHLALFDLARGGTDEALSIFDAHCWARERDFSQDQIGAVSLLMRLELAGADVGERWAAVGAHLAARKADVSQPFLSLQYFYGLLRAGRPEADELLGHIREAPDRTDLPSAPAWAAVGVTLAEALLAHAEKRHEDVVRLLDAAIGRLPEIGGSHAQRELFDSVLLDALVKGGFDNRAQQALERKRAVDPLNAPARRALAAIYRRNGLEAFAP